MSPAARPPIHKRRSAFTLVELLVVVTVVAMLLSMLLVGLGSARGAAQRALCLNNLRELGFAVQIYVEQRDAYPPAYVNDRQRWMDLLKPYVESGKRSQVFQCPADREKIPVVWDPEILLSYGMNSFRFKDAAHCFWYPVDYEAVKLRAREIILLADCKPGMYYVGGGTKFGEPVANIEYRHPGRSFNVLFCDGRADTKIDTVQRDWDAAQ